MASDNYKPKPEHKFTFGLWTQRLSALCLEYKSEIANAFGVIVYEAKNNASQVSRECGVRRS